MLSSAACLRESQGVWGEKLMGPPAYRLAEKLSEAAVVVGGGSEVGW